MLCLAAALRTSEPGDSLDGVHAALGGSRGGGLVTLAFAIALLASGLAATAVGAQAGAVVMDGLTGLRVSRAGRRLVTLVPAMVVLAVGIDPTRALVLSQVVLSFGIPFAIVPLVVLTSRRSVMGDAANRLPVAVAAAAITLLVVALNAVLLLLTLR